MCFLEHVEGCYGTLPVEQITSKIEPQAFQEIVKKNKKSIWKDKLTSNVPIEADRQIILGGKKNLDSKINA